MAIQAAAVSVDVEAAGIGGMSGNGRYSLAAHVIGRRVAVQAQEWHFFLEQPRIYGAMRIVAVGALFANGLVFPQHRTALVGVTAIASVVDPHLPQQIGACRAMRIVAIGADHFAFADGMVGILQRERTLLGMASKANVGLRRFDQYRILVDVDRVTADAGQIVNLVLAALPIIMIAVLVTAEANLIADRDRRSIRPLEDHGR